MELVFDEELGSWRCRPEMSFPAIVPDTNEMICSIIIDEAIIYHPDIAVHTCPDGSFAAVDYSLEEYFC